MLIILTFLMGVANFALHKAVLASRHPLFEGTRGVLPRGVGGFTLAVEFVVLLAAMAFAFNEAGWAAAAYAIYTVANGFAAWMILSRRL